MPIAEKYRVRGIDRTINVIDIAIKMFCRTTGFFIAYMKLIKILPNPYNSAPIVSIGKSLDAGKYSGLNKISNN